MITYYGYTISPNQLETGEGFLICRNVPIARTGTQDYLGSEVGKPEQTTVKVDRPEAEVFSPAAIASFEGKPFTDDHPPVLLTPENAGLYEKGHIQNVRRGTGEFADFLVGDIHVHDAATISAIQNGKRQISCGYECEYAENPDGSLSQKNIRGNHVALVDEGRAGSKAAIMDSNTYKKAATPPERKEKSMSKSNTFLRLFGLAAAGKTPEEVTQLAEDSAHVFDAAPETEGAEEEKAASEKPVEDEDYSRKLYESIDGKLDKLLAALMPKENAGDPEIKQDEDPIEAALETIEEELKGEETPMDEGAAEEEAHVVPAEEMDAEEKKPEEDCGPAMDAATAKSLITALRPSIAAISNEQQRKAVTDALLSAVKRPAQVNYAAKIAEAAQKNAVMKQGSAPKMEVDKIQALYDARNPHLRKEN